MKIVQINTTSIIGSTGRFVNDLSNTLPQVEKELLITRWERKNRNSPHLRVHITNSLLDLFLHGLKSYLFDGHGLGSRRFTKSVITKIDDFNPDVIYIHNIHGYYIHYPSLFEYFKRSNRKVIWTLFDCWAFTGHCSFFSFNGCEKYKTGCGDCPQIRSYPKALSDSSSKNHSLKKLAFNQPKNLEIVVHSDWLKELVLQSFLGQHLVHVVNNGVNTELFKPKEKVQPNKKLRVIAVANIWTRRKGLNDLLSLSSELDHSKYELAIVGLSRKQVKSISEPIICLPKTGDVKSLVDYYQAADIFINTTYDDNFPTVNLEALSCGLPVITYDTGGSPEAVDDKTGRIIPKGHIRGLLKTIDEISGWDRIETIKYCRERAINRFDKSKQLLKYAKIANSVH